MQEFRPASAIAEDADLAERLRQGDDDAIRSLIARYGAAVTAVVSTPGAQDAGARASDVFIEAQRSPLPPGGDFAPWLFSIAAERSVDIDPTRWAAARAVSAVDPEVRPVLRRHHVDGLTLDVDVDRDIARHELRLERRLSHLGDPDVVRAALADPGAWVEADPDLAPRVLAAVGGSPPGGEGAASPTVVADIEPADDTDERAPVSRVTRSLRPVALGIAGGLVVLFVAVIALSAASGTPKPPDYTVELIPTGVLAEVEGGEITVTERDAGIEIELDAVTLPRRGAGTFYEGRLVLADGREISTGTFAEGDDVTLWGGTALDEVVAFRIVTGEDAAADSGDVVLKADLPPS